MVGGMEVEGLAKEEVALVEALDLSRDTVAKVEDSDDVGEVVVEGIGEGEGEGSDEELGISESQEEEVDSKEPRMVEESIVKGDNEMVALIVVVDKA